MADDFSGHEHDWVLLEECEVEIKRLTADLAAARLERDEARALNESYEKHCVPISDDGTSVFIDGPGDQAIDWNGERLKRAESAESTVAQQAARIAGLEGALRRIADSTGDPARPDYLTRTGLVVVANDALSGGPSAIQPCSVVAAAQRFVAQFYARGEGWLSYDDIRPLRDALNGSPTPVSAPVRTALRAAAALLAICKALDPEQAIAPVQMQNLHVALAALPPEMMAPESPDV